MSTDIAKSSSTSDRNAEPTTLGEYNGFEVYPMPFFAKLVASDPEALGRWYERALGFGMMFMGPVVHLRRRKYQDLLVVKAGPGESPTTGGPLLNFDADGEMDRLAEQARQEPTAGPSAVVGPVETPWNTLELRVTDPAGYQLVFTSRRAQPDPELHARAQAMFEAGRRK